jgi:hypothetical protein
MIHLYIKTHRKTGLKYLGKTVRDPYNYKGSGTLWMRHLEKHGNDVDTEIIFSTRDKEEIKQKGIYYSNLWNITESSDWANLRPEEGDGGDTFSGRKHKPETIQVMKEKASKRPPTTPETCEKISKAKLGISISLPPRTQEHCENLSKSLKGKKSWNEGIAGYKHKKEHPKETCVYCGITATKTNITRWHNEKCKSRPK